VATLTRSAVVAAPPEAVWELISDARTLPGWWPAVTRVEGVAETGFTEVLLSRRGRPVRLDMFYTEVQAPQILSWELEITGTQFERMLGEWVIRCELSPADGGTRVMIEERQSFRGTFRTGGFLQRRAARKRVDGALAGLAALL
jgi:uncharacterized protein YndB with AHSA1/START domain